jgi:Protein of unknown function (DUF3060)
MTANEDPEDRIRELERPLADAARASEAGSSQPAGQGYPPAPPGPPPPPPAPWTYGGPFPGPPQQGSSGNRVWWIVGTLIAVGTIALAGGIAAFAAHQLSGVRSIISSPPTISGTFGPPPSAPTSPGPYTRTKPATPSASPTPPAGGELSVAGMNESRTIVCNDSVVSVSGISNTVVITGHCASLSVSGVQNAITVDAVDSIDASGLDNKVTYHSGTPKITNSGDSNVVQQG